MRFALLFAAGCFTGNPPPPPEPAPPQHSCASAATRLTDILVAGHDATPGSGRQFHASVERSCTADHWSLAAIECIDASADHRAIKACANTLSEAQIEPIERAAKAAHHEPQEQGQGLAVTSIEPDTGDAAGGTYVRIIGRRFIADGARQAKVYFGNRQGTIVRFASDTELIVEAPGGNPGEQVDVLVIFEPGGELGMAKSFTFVTKP